ncbi:hypothetical protein OsI_24611 [Oryza sativa Indica Group]|uniref:Uncharacterized protein n=1 Tax=Oryza sativa subsp. indica TaxID=39946 RepID=B8B6K6_ORYSI|nr:hypothetical protein OsI_24611 [Oryza sativa Indica Group]
MEALEAKFKDREEEELQRKWQEERASLVTDFQRQQEVERKRLDEAWVYMASLGQSMVQPPPAFTPPPLPSRVLQLLL